jgi:hypothetical protein
MLVAARLSAEHVERLLAAVSLIASTPPPPGYGRDPLTGDYWPAGLARPGA